MIRVGMSFQCAIRYETKEDKLPKKVHTKPTYRKVKRLYMEPGVVQDTQGEVWKLGESGTSTSGWEALE